MATKSRTYNDAIDALNTLQSPYAVIAARNKAWREGREIPGEETLPEMRVYLKRLGYTVSDLDRLNMVHIAGTKGKGSTCAFVDSILGSSGRAHGVPRKVGLFTSPHLVAVRERIRIGSSPISEDLFARYFFEVWDRLEQWTSAGGNDVEVAQSSSGSLTMIDSQPPPAPQQNSTSDPVAPIGPFLPNQSTRTTPWPPPPAGSKPTYARYLTLMSWHVFLSEGCDATVYETGIGGEVDATNLVEHPVAAGITALGIDHVNQLGRTIRQIAWHKAGIMKSGGNTENFAVEQVLQAEGGVDGGEAAMEVLQARARGKGVQLHVVGIDPRLDGVRIRPDAPFQRRNASLAVALAEAALRRIDPAFAGSSAAAGGEGKPRLTGEFVDGLENVVWRGRCEVKDEGEVTWHLDGAHTVDSLRMAARWFKGEVAGRPGPRALIFNQQGRSEAIEFLEGLYKSAKPGDGSPFQLVLFCTNVTYAATGYKRDFVNHQHDSSAVANLTVQKSFADKWRIFDSTADVRTVGSIEEALNQVRELSSTLERGEKVQAFVTGSLHLVGGALGVLEGSDAL